MFSPKSHGKWQWRHLIREAFLNIQKVGEGYLFTTRIDHSFPNILFYLATQSLYFFNFCRWRGLVRGGGLPRDPGGPLPPAFPAAAPPAAPPAQEQGRHGRLRPRDSFIALDPPPPRVTPMTEFQGRSGKSEAGPDRSEAGPDGSKAGPDRSEAGPDG